MKEDKGGNGIPTFFRDGIPSLSGNQKKKVNLKHLNVGNSPVFRIGLKLKDRRPFGRLSFLLVSCLKFQLPVIDVSS
jgi:hypothetical protein